MVRVTRPGAQPISQAVVERSPCSASDTRRWYAVQTKNRKERLVISRLSEQGIPYYRPMLLAPRARGARRESLFPNYLFVRIGSVEESVRVRYTWGVKGVVSYAGAACPVDDDVIELIRRQEGTDGSIRVSKVFRFRKNARVRLAGGAFHGLEAIFCQYLPARDRIHVLVTLLGRPVLTELHQDRASPVL
ncbi:MAG TPA: transcription termination/antitermination NusG family protein [Acidobacteriota bacterium]|nr:transcription termination/antitermination NusG family protein [Acidobacteriota bacterium]